MSFLGVIRTSLSANKSAYIVGDKPVYQIVGAKAGSRVLWTTWRNSENLEYEKSYGEVIGSNGAAELTHPAFIDEDVGYWEQQVLIVSDADGTQEAAQIFFTVSPVAAAQAQPMPIAEPPGFFDQKINLFGAELPSWLVIGGGLFLALKLFKK